MLTKLRFQNWRSLQDVTIENLTPLTVFIGANSSGKSNIVDGIRFLREATINKPIQAIQNRRGHMNVRTAGVGPNQPIEVEVDFDSVRETMPTLRYRLGLQYGESNIPSISEYLDVESGEVLIDKSYHEARLYLRGNLGGVAYTIEGSPLPAIGWGKTALSEYGEVPSYFALKHILQLIKERWQILDEGFRPLPSLPADTYGDIALIDGDAANLPIILHFLKEAAPDKYAQLQDDLQQLMGHIGQVATAQDDRETRFYIQEKNQRRSEAPTISAGTARLVAMLTAYYALDIGPRASMPGLVVIEEPDTALNPWILRDFVGFLRRSVEGEHPRQFILTTHNPALLDYFEPEEVRLVTRDGQGLSHVHAIPDHLKTVWGDPVALGEVWMTNAFGDMPL